MYSAFNAALTDLFHQMEKTQLKDGIERAAILSGALMLKETMIKTNDVVRTGLTKALASLSEYCPDDILQICPNCDTMLTPITDLGTDPDNTHVTWVSICEHCKSKFRFRLSVEEE